MLNLKEKIEILKGTIGALPLEHSDARYLIKQINDIEKCLSNKTTTYTLFVDPNNDAIVYKDDDGIILVFFRTELSLSQIGYILIGIIGDHQGFFEKLKELYNTPYIF